MAKRHLTVFERELAVMRLVKLDGEYATFHMVKALPGNATYNRQGGFFHRDSVMWKPPQLWTTESLEAGEISRIHVGEIVTPLLFGILRQRDDRILIETADGKEFSFLRSREGKFFDEYRRELERFAKENNITYADATR